ncbi:hypothetical protein [Chitinimonas sp. BJYL2]|uniref:hypothetical protein n=1 Tax=Chitinimonas sp. BJYL2 TaxID=2976696 RepID=UPI0022B5E456|nr:hypothetical protein [Chitinimonas sp. BJYL2]
MKHSIFEYLYRDAGNFKAWGELLLDGELTDEEVARMSARFEGGELFIAEQIGVPALCEKLWRECGSKPSNEFDHVWHEFSGVRTANSEECARLKLWGTASALLARIEKVASWDIACSPNRRLG